MKTYLTLSAIALAAAATLSSGTVLAQAAAPAPEYTIGYNVGATSDYRVRGLKQNNSNPSIQGGVDFGHKSGLYAGIWGSTVSEWTAAGSSANLEMDFYGGYKTELAGVALDFGMIYYNYPGASKPNLSDTREVYIGAAYGPAAFKVSRVMSNNYFASTGSDASGTMYYDLTLSQEVMPKLTASVHAGYTDYKEEASLTSANGKFSYADYNVGLTYDYEGYMLGVKYFINDAKAGTKAYATTLDSKNLYKDGFAVSVLKAF
jgi:uncharacterized protein (TIGR02001 family)